MKETMGQGPTHALVEQDEEKADAVSLGGEAVAVTSPDPVQEAMALYFAQVVTQLGQGVGLGVQAESSEHPLVDLGGAPAAEGGTGVKQHLHETDHAGVVDLDARDAAVGRDDGPGQTLEQGKVHRDIQGLGLEGGEALGDPGQGFSHRTQMLQRLLEPEVTEVIA